MRIGLLLISFWLGCNGGGGGQPSPHPPPQTWPPPAPAAPFEDASTYGDIDFWWYYLGVSEATAVAAVEAAEQAVAPHFPEYRQLKGFIIARAPADPSCNPIGFDMRNYALADDLIALQNLYPNRYPCLAGFADVRRSTLVAWVVVDEQPTMRHELQHIFWWFNDPVGFCTATIAGRQVTSQKYTWVGHGTECDPL